MAEVFFRLRITFEKGGSLRWLSHLELARAMERLIRRAGLPYAVSQGFNTHMRFAPGPALPVGTAGMQELFDVWLCEYVNLRHALESLQGAAPRELAISAVGYVSPGAKGLQATHIYERYSVVLRAAETNAEDMRERLAQVVAQGELTVRRRSKDKTYDLTSAVVSPLLVEVVADGAADGTNIAADAADAADCYVVTLSLKASESGSLRPEYLLNAALETFELVSVTRSALADEPPCPSI
ncbi:MAG: TIGR03936 family radical SAM-associated protein [Coriobacteriales bacterium]|nr:TIGR03936 family radical SAM-associated protein [Coriobacteriales bacterium]